MMMMLMPVQECQYNFFCAGMGWMVLPITTRVLEQNFMPYALLGTTPVSQRKTGNPIFGWEPSLWYKHQLARPRTNDCLFNSTMTAYIIASPHYLAAIPPIRHLEDTASLHHLETRPSNLPPGGLTDRI